MKQISTSVSSFEEYIKGGSVYVDKTQYVWDLVNSTDKAFFLSRPRRFGKSMFLSTLEAYFQGKKDLFTGLKIEKLAPEDWEQWPVVHLDMARAATLEGMDAIRHNMCLQVQNAAQDNGILLEQDAPGNMLDSLISKLYMREGKAVVVLIDEYDKPILDALQKPWTNEVVAALHEFYQTLKSRADKERFVFVTGVSKFAHTSLFSGMNNLKDISTEEVFATMLGYTKQELRDNFADYIAAAATKHQISQDDLLERMKDWYDGFRFTPDSETLFNPVSVGKFFGEYKFSNYWYETGTPSFLIEQLKNNPFALEDYTQMWFPEDDFSKCDINHLNPLSLAIQTGYLTIKESMVDGNVTLCRYDLPNTEIRQSWSRSMLPLMYTDDIWVYGKQNQVRVAMNNGDVDTLMSCLQSLVAGLSYENIGEVREGYYRNILKVAFTAWHYHANCEDHTAQGRVDMVVQSPSQAYVFELKVQNSDSETEKLLAEAVDQATLKHYADKYQFESDKVHTIAVVFDKNQHRLVAWRKV